MKTIISHASQDVEYFERVDEIKKRIESSYTPEEQKHLYDLLHRAENSYLGQFLLVNQGLNGPMTQYVVLYPKYRNEHPGTYPNGVKLNAFDRTFLEKYPTVLATQERFDIFQTQIKKHLQSDSKIATLPCGLMDDLLTLDLPSDFAGRFTGIDADPISIQQAHANASAHKKAEMCDFYIQDAWKLDLPHKYDLIVSNGLNIYVDSEENVISLYKSFYDNLADNGVLITSFLTPSPALSDSSEWDREKIDMASAKEQKEMFVDILGVNWTHFYSSRQVEDQLKAAGFKSVKIHWDTQRLFPTVVAYK